MPRKRHVGCGPNEIFSVREKIVRDSITTPAKPVVTAEDTANKITGLTTEMEISLDDGKTWTKVTDVDMLFEGNKTVLVRVAAVEGVSNVSDTVSLTFTVNLTTPAKPAVTAEDTANKITGLTTEMEISLDDGKTWTKVTDVDMLFEGNKTVLVRVAAVEGVSNVSDTVSLTFTVNLTTPAKPAVTAEDTANKITGLTTEMEISLDDGKTWTKVTDVDMLFEGNKTVLVRVAAVQGLSNVSEATTVTFTE